MVGVRGAIATSASPIVTTVASGELIGATVLEVRRSVSRLNLWSGIEKKERQ